MYGISDKIASVKMIIFQLDETMSRYRVIILSGPFVSVYCIMTLNTLFMKR